MLSNENECHRTRRASGTEIPTELLKVEEDFSSLVKLLESAYPQIQLPIPSHPDLTSWKEFCSGLLERKTHPWDGALSKCPPTVRWSISASLFLFRKRLPSAPDPESVQNFLHKMSSQAAPVRDDFMKFVEAEVPRLFKRGWDRGYGRRCDRSTLSTSACLSNARWKGGVRASGISFHRYSEMTRGDREVPYDPTVRVSSVIDGGKERIVTVGGKERSVLKPLHTLLYDHLSRKSWLLRGDAKQQRFKDFTLKKGEIFVSGDYESATDNLSLEFYEFLLKQVLDTCETVPDSIRDYALLSARSIICTKDNSVSVPQLRGQLMGNLLSFPFLCLTNYLAFKFFVRRKGIPVKINGDDIVFRCRRREYELWCNGLQSIGMFKLSAGKTLVDSQVFSLNSTFFSARRTHQPRFVPLIRSKCLFTSPDSDQW